MSPLFCTSRSRRSHRLADIQSLYLAYRQVSQRTSLIETRSLITIRLHHTYPNRLTKSTECVHLALTPPATPPRFPSSHTSLSDTHDTQVRRYRIIGPVHAQWQPRHHRQPPQRQFALHLLIPRNTARRAKMTTMGPTRSVRRGNATMW